MISTVQIFYDDSYNPYDSQSPCRLRFLSSVIPLVQTMWDQAEPAIWDQMHASENRWNHVYVTKWSQVSSS